MSMSCTSNSFAKIWDIQDKDGWAEVRMSTSRKDKKSGEYVNSYFSFVRFTYHAYDKIKKMSVGDKIANIQLSLSMEPYVKNGEKIYPKSVKITVFDFDEVFDDTGRKPKGPAPVDEYDPGDGELPF